MNRRPRDGILYTKDLLTIFCPSADLLQRCHSFFRSLVDTKAIFFYKLLQVISRQKMKPASCRSTGLLYPEGLQLFFQGSYSAYSFKDSRSFAGLLQAGALRNIFEDRYHSDDLLGSTRELLIDIGPLEAFLSKASSFRATADQRYSTILQWITQFQKFFYY